MDKKMERFEKDQLIMEVVDKINVLNRHYIEVIDSYREIFKTNCYDDLVYLRDILNRKITGILKQEKLGYEIELKVKDCENDERGDNLEEYTDGNGY